MDVKREPLGGSVLTQGSCPDGVCADMISEEIMDRRSQAVAYGDACIMCVYVCVCVCIHVCVYFVNNKLFGAKVANSKFSKYVPKYQLRWKLSVCSFVKK